MKDLFITTLLFTKLALSIKPLFFKSRKKVVYLYLSFVTSALHKLQFSLIVASSEHHEGLFNTNGFA